MNENKPRNEEKPFVEEWQKALSRRLMEEAAEELKKMPPPKETPPPEDQPTYIGDAEKQEITERVA